MSLGFQPVYTPAPRSGPPTWLLGLIGLGAIIIVALVAFVFLSGNQASPSPTPTAVAASATPSATSSAAPTVTAGQSAPPSAGVSPSVEPSGSATPGATIDPALAALIDAVIRQVPPVRQLEPTGNVPYELISRDQFRNDLIELNDEDVPPDFRAAEERLLKRLGLLPDDADLEALILDLLGAQVAAFYRPDNGRFYIVQRDAAFGPLDRIVTAHEFTHALQDQHFDLEGTRITDLAEGDAALAQLAVIEGDATLTSQLWAEDNLSGDELLQLLTDALSGLDQQTLDAMPLVLRRQLEFPYTEGFLFVSDIYGLGGFEAVDQAIQTPPASTEQILHSDKYYASEAPVTITMEDVSATLGTGWSRTYAQTIGELGIQILATGGEEPAITFPGLPVTWPYAEVAAGWGGDRLNMYEGPDGSWRIDWLTAWDSPSDADEFLARATELATTFDGVATVGRSSIDDPSATNQVWVRIASDESVLAL